MPELPEVECFARLLNAACAGKTCKEIQLHRPNLRYQFDKKALAQVFGAGAKIISISRTHKQLVFQTSAGKVNVSLGMSGSFVFRRPDAAVLLHEHVTIVLNQSQHLCYVDPRRFGYWKVSDGKHVTPNIANALVSQELDAAFKDSNAKTTSIKSLLMDQSKIGGLGNIYVLEALFISGISPLRICNTVKSTEWKKLSNCIPVLLHQAIEAGGSSIATYRNLHGSKGEFQALHKVYGRAGQPCLNCSTTIVKVVQSGRSSFYCIRCQK